MTGLPSESLFRSSSWSKRVSSPATPLVVSELSRLGRSLGQVVTILDTLAKSGVAFVAIKENIHVDGERNIQTRVMTERTREGLARARASGRKLGRPGAPPAVDIPRSDRRQPPAPDVGDPPRVIALAHLRLLRGLLAIGPREAGAPLLVVDRLHLGLRRCRPKIFTRRGPESLAEIPLDADKMPCHHGPRATR